MPAALRYLRSLLGILVTSMGTVSVGFAADLIAYTEEWAPYNFTEGDAIRGISTDILRAACSAEKLDCEIRMVPWARAYKSASHEPNTLVFTTARKPSREQEFLWVGPILPRTTWVYGRAGLENTVRTLQDLAPHRIGVVRDEAAQQDLAAAGLPASVFVVQPSNADVLKMLGNAMVDAMVDTEVGMEWNLRNAAMAPNTVKKLLKLSDGGAYYYAFNLHTDPAMVRKLQSAVEQLRRSGKIDAIVRQYAAKLP